MRAASFHKNRQHLSNFRERFPRSQPSWLAGLLHYAQAHDADQAQHHEQEKIYCSRLYATGKQTQLFITATFAFTTFTFFLGFLTATVTFHILFHITTAFTFTAFALFIGFFSAALAFPVLTFFA